MNLTEWAQGRQHAANKALRRATAEKNARKLVARQKTEPDTASPLNALLRELAVRNLRNTSPITKENNDA